MAAPRQNEMNDNATVVAMTILADPGRFEEDDSSEAEVDTETVVYCNAPPGPAKLC